MNPSIGIRTQIEELLAQGQWQRAYVRLGDLWRQESRAATAAYVLSAYGRMQGDLPVVKCRVSFLRSMTIEPVVPILRSAALVAGIDLYTQVGQFNSYAQEILDPDSSLYSFGPDIVILTIQTRDILPEIWESYADMSQAEAVAAVDRVCRDLAAWIRTFRQRSRASLIVHNFEQPPLSFGVFDAQAGDGQSAAIDRLNRKLQAICNEYRGIYMLDYDALISRHGRLNWHDELKWLTTRLPFATDSLLPLAMEWLRFIHPLTGTICKVLAVDLDNTLWGGVLGEDGPEVLQVGPEYPGVFYRSVQRALLDLHHRGVLLAVCSKNNYDEAMSALRSVPGMLVRPEHFAAFGINWKDKTENLRQIASELNVGIDAIAFLDDNPIERDLVRTRLPEVKVLDLPIGPQGYAKALRECPLFERLSISAEDREHTRMYREHRDRKQLEESAGSLEDFYCSLQQEITIESVSSQTIARVAQLTQKTNQFNVTMCRYSEQDIEECASRAGWNVYSVRVKDRFGDNGIVGVLITHTDGDICEIDTFLLSCRVIGRTIETAMLGYLTSVCRAAGVTILQGWFVPTAKNAPGRQLYASHQFQSVATRGNATLWSLNLTEADIVRPGWLRLVSDATQSVEPVRA